MNTYLEEGTTGNLGSVVFDELHMVEDGQRGYFNQYLPYCETDKLIIVWDIRYILEVLVTKLICLQQPIQLIGMSATLSVCITLILLIFWIPKLKEIFQNISEVAAWLQASCYNSTYRPIPLREYIVYENEVYDEHDRIAAHIPLSQMKELKDPVTNAVVSLVYGCVVEGYSALVFCSTRDMTEKRAVNII